MLTDHLEYMRHRVTEQIRAAEAYRLRKESRRSQRRVNLSTAPCSSDESSRGG